MTPLEKTEVELRVTETARPVETARKEESIQFPEYLIVLAKRKAFVFKFVGAALLLSIITVLLLPNSYTGNAKILPPQQNQSMGAIAALSQLGPLATLAGQSMGLRNPSDVYVAMLKSDSLANGLIDRFSLMSVYGRKLRIDARRRLADQTEISAGKDGVISISVDDHDPRRAAALANAYVDELEQ